MDQHAGHAERIGDQAGVLAAGAAETVQRIAGHVVAALNGDFLDRVRHVLDGDLDEAVGNLFGRAAVADVLRQGGERCAHRVGIERQILLRPEYFREEVGDQLADHDVRIGHGERTAAAITFRTGIGAGGIGADAKPRTIEVKDRAAAGRDGVDQHHRRAHAHARHLGFERALVLAGEMRHVRGGAAHVETDQTGKSRRPPGLRHADHARGRARQDRVLAAKQFGRRQAARRHHEHELRFPSPLWGGVRGGGSKVLRRRRRPALGFATPLPTLPHKGGGNRRQLVRHLGHVAAQGWARDSCRRPWYRRGRRA